MRLLFVLGASADAVTVVRILHGARDLPGLFRSDDEAS